MSERTDTFNQDDLETPVAGSDTSETGNDARPKLDQASANLGWHITRRWHSYEGEIRTSILRALLVSVFYGIQLVHYLGFSQQNAAAVTHHQRITYLCGAWLLVSLVVLVSLRQRLFPPLLKFFTTGFDLTLLTIAACFGAGTASPLIGCYFLIVAMAALRFSLPLIWFTSLGAIIGYMAVVGWSDPTWFDSDHRTPPVTQLVTISALAATGVVLGQMVRMLRGVAEEFYLRYEYLNRLASSSAAAKCTEGSNQ